MSTLELAVMSLRYSSWSIRPWLALTHAGAKFSVRTADLAAEARQSSGGGITQGDIASVSLKRRRALGSVTGLFPVLWIDGEPIHEALAICEWVAEAYPEAKLWPERAMDRARARSISSEMATNFTNLRTHLSCNVFARVPGFIPDAATGAEIERVFEIWRACLDRSGGPFLFGAFGIADSMYFPVLTRFRTYQVELASDLGEYARAVEESRPVTQWRRVAREAPALPAYDAKIRELGGNPMATLAEL